MAIALMFATAGIVLFLAGLFVFPSRESDIRQIMYSHRPAQKYALQMMDNVHYALYFAGYGFCVVALVIASHAA